MLLLFKVFPGLFLSTLLLAAQSDRPSVIAFINANVVSGDSEKVLQNQTVVVEGDRIVKVGPADQVAAPAGATSVNAAGKYLMPGIGEMHGHIPPPDDPELERVLFLFVANGVTTVRGMLGFPNQLALRDRINRGELLGPTLYLAGPSFSGSSVRSAEQAKERVRQQKAEGWDLLKVHPGLTREQFDAMARTAGEVGMRFAGHVPTDVGLLHPLEAGLETVDHLDAYIEHLGGERVSVPESVLRDVARRTREVNAWVVPTMVLWETLLGASSLETLSKYDGLNYMPSTQIENWKAAYRQRVGRPDFSREKALLIAENRKRLLRVLSEEGVKILFGTDSPQQFSVPGFSIHRELRTMQEAGMSAAEIVRSATANIGDYFSSKDKFGLIKPGMRADLILLEGDPLADLQALQKRSGVMVRGRWIPEVEIQKRLAELEVGKPQSAAQPEAAGGTQMSTRAFQASYYEAMWEPGAVRSSPGKIYRDSSGRIRVDYCVEIGSKAFRAFCKIYDPAQNAMFVVNDTNRTILVMRHPAGSQVTVIGFPNFRNLGANPKQEALGSKEIEGVLCQGHGLGGAAEFWISEELGGIPILALEDGEVLMRISDIVLTEPDPEVFAIPADYQIQQESGPR